MLHTSITWTVCSKGTVQFWIESTNVMLYSCVSSSTEGCNVAHVWVMAWQVNVLRPDAPDVSEGFRRPRTCHVQLADVWLIVRNSSTGSHTKASDFRECSPSVEPPALAHSTEAQSFEDEEAWGVNSHRLMMQLFSRNWGLLRFVYVSRFSDDARLQLNEDYSFQIRHPSSALSSRTCQIRLSIAATGWCTRKAIFRIMPLKRQPLFSMQ